MARAALSCFGPQDLIADFFAGSGTTGHAVLEANLEDGGSRRFLLVQLPEPYDRGGFETVAAVGKERLRRAVKALKKNVKRGEDALELGFRVLSLSTSNYKVWQDYRGDNAEDLQTLFDQAETPLVKDWTPAGLLTEVTLVEGFPLDSKVEAGSGAKANKVSVVTSEYCGHRLLVCLEKQLSDSIVKGLQLEESDVFVCLDGAVTDEQKLLLADRCNLKTI